MTEKRVFVIRNQFNQYLDKHSGWQSGKDANALFRADFHDQALNTLFEINSKDISLRGKILEVTLDEKKRPVVEVSDDAILLDNNMAVDESAEDETNNDDDDETGAEEITSETINETGNSLFFK